MSWCSPVVVFAVPCFLGDVRIVLFLPFQGEKRCPFSSGWSASASQSRYELQPHPLRQQGSAPAVLDFLCSSDIKRLVLRVVALFEEASVFGVRHQWPLLFSVYFLVFDWYFDCNPVPASQMSLTMLKGLEGMKVDSIKFYVAPTVVLFLLSCFSELLIVVRSRSSPCLPKQHAYMFANHCTLGYAIIDFMTSRSFRSLQRCSTVLREHCFVQVVSVSKVDSRPVAQARHALGSRQHITGIVMHAGDGMWLGRMEPVIYVVV